MKYDDMTNVAEDVLIHYGIKRRSGRYPWGSGEHPYQSDPSFRKSYGERVRDVKNIVSQMSKDEQKLYDIAALRSPRNIGKSRINVSVVYDNSKPVAFSTYQRQNLGKGNIVAEVKVGVVPEYRNHGGGKLLIHDLAQRIKNNDPDIQKIVAMASVKNHAATSMLQSLGFEPDFAFSYSEDEVGFIFKATPDEILNHKVKHAEVMDPLQTAEDVLVHYGIKRRSGRYPYGSGENPYQREKNPPHQAERKAKKEKAPKDPVKMERKELIKSKNLHSMSPDDLQKMINRLKQEKELKNLVEADIAPGKKAMKEILADVGKQTAKEVLSGSVRYGINYALQDSNNRKFSTVDLARAIYPSLNKQEEKKKKGD